MKGPPLKIKGSEILNRKCNNKHVPLCDKRMVTSKGDISNGILLRNCVGIKLVKTLKKKETCIQ